MEWLNFERTLAKWIYASYEQELFVDTETKTKYNESKDTKRRVYYVIVNF